MPACRDKIAWDTFFKSLNGHCTSEWKIRSFRRSLWHSWKALTVSLPSHTCGLLSYTPHEAIVSIGFILNLRPDLIIIICCRDGRIWNWTFPRVKQDLIYGSVASSEVWRGNYRSWRGQKEERRRYRSCRKEAHFVIALLCIGIIYLEIYSLRLFLREYSLMGSLFVCPAVPDSSWHVHVCI